MQDTGDMKRVHSFSQDKETRASRGLHSRHSHVDKMAGGLKNATIAHVP